MNLSLSLVREVLRTALGHDSFVAGFIRSIAPDESVPTACINGTGDLRYNPQFLDEHISSREDLFCLVFHELLHPLFLHYRYGGGMLANLGCDAVINAVIARLFPDPSGSGSLFRKLYGREGVEMLLRPGCDPRHSRYEGLYEGLHETRWKTSRLSTGEVIQSLKVLTDKIEIPAVVLLGSHGQENDSEGSASALPTETLARIAEEIKHVVCENQEAGYHEALTALFLQALQTHLALKRRLLRDFLTKTSVDRFRDVGLQTARQSSPIPIAPGKRDLTMLAAGVYPVYFHNRTTRLSTRRQGLAVYLDVSGSVNEHLPQIVGVLRSLRNDLASIFLFSNKVAEIPFRDLIDKGRVETTYGTDFDCVAESILAKGFEKAVVVSDGYASLNEANREKLKKARTRVLTILFGKGQSCEDLAPFGPVMTLEQMVEGLGQSRWPATAKATEEDD